MKILCFFLFPFADPVSALQSTLQEFCRIRFVSDFFREIAAPNVVKTAFLEACGDLHDQGIDSFGSLMLGEDAAIDGSEGDGMGLHLVGQRLAAYATFFAHRTLSSHVGLPFRVFSIGTAYEGRRVGDLPSNLRDLGQYPVCSFFAAGRSVGSLVDFCSVHVSFAIREIAARLGLHVRFVLCSPAELGLAEMARLRVEIWFPGAQEWMDAGKICFLGSYLSERVGFMICQREMDYKPSDVVVEPLGSTILHGSEMPSITAQSLRGMCMACRSFSPLDRQKPEAHEDAHHYYADCLYGELNLLQVLASLVETYWSEGDVEHLPECLKELLMFEL